MTEVTNRGFEVEAAKSALTELSRRIGGGK